jgi:hypothetical protein
VCDAVRVGGGDDDCVGLPVTQGSKAGPDNTTIEEMKVNLPKFVTDGLSVSKTHCIKVNVPPDPVPVLPESQLVVLLPHASNIAEFSTVLFMKRQEVNLMFTRK